MPLLLVAVVVLGVACAGIIFIINVVPSLSGRPDAGIVGCDVEEHKVPFPNEAGFAQVAFEITNQSAKDRLYIVGVAVRTEKGGEVVGTAEHRVGVPANHTRQESWRVTLTKQGGHFCQVTKAVRE